MLSDFIFFLLVKASNHANKKVLDYSEKVGVVASVDEVNLTEVTNTQSSSVLNSNENQKGVVGNIIMK